jgi:TetR/AcrR family transcriptional regulator, transcriptional repressor of bet genes
MPKLGMRAVRRVQVFSAATEVIARETFCGTTIRKVAEAAGVSTGTVNHYFANKRSMLIETLAHVAREWNEDLRVAVEQAAPGPGRLAALMAAVAPGNPVNQIRWKVWTAAWSEAVASREVRSALRSSNQRWIALLTEKFELINREMQGPDINASAVARTFGALLNGLIIQMLASDGALDQEIPEVIHDYLFQNIGRGAAEPDETSYREPSSLRSRYAMVGMPSPAPPAQPSVRADTAREVGVLAERQRQQAVRRRQEGMR